MASESPQYVHLPINPLGVYLLVEYSVDPLDRYVLRLPLLPLVVLRLGHLPVAAVAQDALQLVTGTNLPSCEVVTEGCFRGPLVLRLRAGGGGLVEGGGRGGGSGGGGGGRGRGLLGGCGILRVWGRRLGGRRSSSVFTVNVRRKGGRRRQSLLCKGELELVRSEYSWKSIRLYCILPPVPPL